MTTAPLLIELFTEELPPKALQKLGDAFAMGVHEELTKAGLVDGDAAMRVFATPRRLGVLLANIRDRAPDRRETRKLMPAKIAFDPQGQPTPALMKRLEKEGVGTEAVAMLERRDVGGIETVFAPISIAGSVLAEAAQQALIESMAKLPIPKVMSYQLADGETTVKFVRPVHGLVVLHGETVLDVEVLGLKAGPTVHGHRFQGGAPINLKDTSEYSQRLEQEGHVIAGFEDRRSRIEKLLRERADETGNSLGPREDYAPLLDEVTALVEYPAVYVGSFDTEFLEVPAECLILTMKQNQKYFPLFHDDGSLSSRFLIVSNLVLSDPRNIIQGNERVVRPRLADARFFFETDKKTKLADRMDKLDHVVYHNKLGTQRARMERVAKLAGTIAGSLGADAAKAERAARLAKCDLVTDMVGEFPELQGTMGRYYALHDGEPPEVADAIAEHYQPRFSGDALPVHPVSLAVALADKMISLAGLFSIGQQPTGDKDPFALRRAALGVVRILVEKDVPLSIYELSNLAFDYFVSNAATELTWFAIERAHGYFLERGFSAKAVDGVLGPLGGATVLSTVASIAEEATKFLALESGQQLAQANKRITNILKKSGAEVPMGISPLALKASPNAALLPQEEEKQLWAELQRVGGRSLELKESRQFAESLRVLAELSGPVTAFFEGVMVNCDDQELRDNRITLLQHARAYMNQVADLSLMAG